MWSFVNNGYDIFYRSFLFEDTNRATEKLTVTQLFNGQVHESSSI